MINEQSLMKQTAIKQNVAYKKKPVENVQAIRIQCPCQNILT